MAQPRTRPRWRRLAAILLVICGGVLLVVGRDNLLLHSLALGLALGGVSLQRQARREAGLPLPSKGLWIAGLVSAVLTVAGYQALIWTARSGYDQAWPLYAFAVPAVASAVIWPAIVARMFYGT